MQAKLNLSIAKALLLARRKQSIIAAVGVTFGIAMFITLLGFMSGLNDLLDGLMLNRTPHVRLYNEISPVKIQPIDQAAEYDSSVNFVQSIKPKNRSLEIKNSLEIFNYLKTDKRVYGVAPKLVTQVFFNVGSTSIAGAVNGIVPEDENRLFQFGENIIEGNYMDLQTSTNSIILGVGLAKNMLVEIGDIVQVTTPGGDRFKLKVIGIYQSGIAELDKVQTYTSVSTAQKLLGVSNTYYTDIQIKLNDLEKAPSVALEYADLFGTEAIDIQTANAQFDTGSSIRSLISYAVGITLLIVAGFGIYNILNMLIYEKMDSIAILKATGFSGKDVSRIFTYIALVIGIFGGLFGLLLGLGFCGLIDQVPFDTEALPSIKTYPMSYSPTYYIIAAVFSVLTTYFAGFFPARKASRIDPVEIIRGK